MQNNIDKHKFCPIPSDLFEKIELPILAKESKFTLQRSLLQFTPKSMES